MTAGDLDAIRWQQREDDEWTAKCLDELLFQVIALEELLATRWPRSILVRARYRRDVRASVREIDGSNFTWRRLNSIGTDWLCRPGTKVHP
jgi:hypothetical protein